MKKIIFLTFAFVLILSSCDDFFSNSWGSPREFKAENITLTTDTIDDLVKRAKKNPELADTITEKFKEKAAEEGLSDKDKAAYVNGGISTAVSASGTGSILYSDGFDDLTDMATSGEFDKEKGKSLVNNMLDGYDKSATAKKAADDVVELADFCLTDDKETPTFNDAFIESAKPDEVGATMLLLVMAVASEKNIDVTTIDDESDLTGLIDGLELDKDNGVIKVTEPPPGEKAVVLAAYVNLVSQNGDKFKNDPLAGSFSKLFGTGSDE